MSDATTPDSENPPTATTSTPFQVWMCILCGFLYDESVGMPDHGVPAGTRWADVPADWICPECSAPKADFEMVEI